MIQTELNISGKIRRVYPNSVFVSESLREKENEDLVKWELAWIESCLLPSGFPLRVG